MADQGIPPQEPQQILPDQQQAVPEEPPPPGSDYEGPKTDQVVGDRGTLNIVGLSPDFDGNEVRLGDAWQSPDGELNGTGVAAVMVFEPVARKRYIALSLENDQSPLFVLSKRLSRCSLIRTELVLSDDNT